MSKGELRKARKAERAAGQTLNVEQREGGVGFEMVRERTAAEERRHEQRMYRCARLAYDYDRDF